MPQSPTSKKIKSRKIRDIIKARDLKLLNLYSPKSIRLPLSLFIKIGAVSFILVFLLGKVTAPSSGKFTGVFSTLAQEATSSVEKIQTAEESVDPNIQRTELEKQLADLERQIEEHEKTIANYQKQGNTLANEINSLNTKIQKLNLQIKAVNLTLEKLNKDINNTQRQINFSENRIAYHKDAIAKSLRILDEADRQTLTEILLANKNLSDFFAALNNIAIVQNNLRIALTEITKLRQNLLAQKEELSLQKEDQENLRDIQQTQKKNVENIQAEKSRLLKITKGKESEYQKLLQKTKETAAQIRSRIFELLGGGELTFEKAYDYARLAGGATGLKPAFILAILHHESLLGKNVGRCAYNQIMSWTGQPAMHPTRDTPYFLDLLSRLNIDPNSTVARVSCPNRDGTFGGAMGPAQFLPSVWKIYESKISQITGNNPPNPWNNADAFAAAALYLQNAMTECRSIYSAPSQQERCAAAKYYAGSRWRNYLWIYGDIVANKTIKFQKDIDILNS